MVDIGGKAITARIACARGHIEMNEAAFTALQTQSTPKGDVLQIAQIAGIMATKKTADLIPLCHPLPLSHVSVQFETDKRENRLWVETHVKTNGKTGVEMEALTATSITLLTVYDMLKALDKKMRIGAVQLVEKSGGKSGHFLAE